MSVLRCYSQKKTGFDVEAQGLLGALRDQLGIRGLESVVILNRYDADQIDPAIYEQAKGIVFSEPQVDAVYDETFPVPEYPHRILAVEALPGHPAHGRGGPPPDRLRQGVPAGRPAH